MQPDLTPAILFLTIAAIILFMMNTSKAKKIRLREQESERERDHARQLSESIAEHKKIILTTERDAKAAVAEADLKARNAIIKVEEMNTILSEKSRHFPWLATAHADYIALKGGMVEDGLRSKTRPALLSADKVRAATQRARDAEFKFRMIKYRLDFFEKFYPWMIELSGDNLEDYLRSLESKESSPSADEDALTEADPVRGMLSETEYRAPRFFNIFV